MSGFKKRLIAIMMGAVFFSMSGGMASADECFDGDCTVTPRNDAERNEMEYDDYGSFGNSSSDSSAKTAESSASPGGNRIDQTGFSFDPRTVSPSSFRYDRGSKGNLQMLFEHVSNLLLIAIATLAALLIAVAGLRMAFSSVNPDEAAKGKTMLKFNLMALAVALLSYAIINVVSWIISAN